MEVCIDKERVCAFSNRHKLTVESTGHEIQNNSTQDPTELLNVLHRIQKFTLLCIQEVLNCLAEVTHV